VKQDLPPLAFVCIISDVFGPTLSFQAEMPRLEAHGLPPPHVLHCVWLC
jgi:hypothetical protein